MTDKTPLRKIAEKDLVQILGGMKLGDALKKERARKQGDAGSAS